MRLFFYGTLLDEDIRTSVLGSDFLPDSVAPAILKGWRRVGVAGRTYPTLIPHPTGRVSGLAVCGLDQAQMRNLLRYEGGEYCLREVRIRLECGALAPARTFLCRPGIRTSPHEWRLSQWRRRHKSAALAHTQSPAGLYPPRPYAYSVNRA